MPKESNALGLWRLLPNGLTRKKASPAPPTDDNLAMPTKGAGPLQPFKANLPALRSGARVALAPAEMPNAGTAQDGSRSIQQPTQASNNGIPPDRSRPSSSHRRAQAALVQPPRGVARYGKLNMHLSIAALTSKGPRGAPGPWSPGDDDDHGTRDDEPADRRHASRSTAQVQLAPLP